ncbi:agamous-like MADS-box protein AGL80 [Trifolium pratense]|uniref:agamous-like MADS-box protein AGL80 n=1 Tax=Trifolium pratense TaxID=57577 RepID=UPI001E690E1D|nr:agamous-like MADS-box protein AGL80 [Trifolium pratense]
MTRKKVKLGFICDDSARKATYKKRKKGIMKKVSELTILCGIPACAIISNPFDSKTEVWPDIAEAKQIIERYQNSSVIDGAKNVNQESFLLQRITKAREQLRKQKHDNHEKELTVRMIGYMKNKQLPDDLSVSDLKQFDKLIDKNLKDLDNKIVELNSFD